MPSTSGNVNRPYLQPNDVINRWIDESDVHIQARSHTSQEFQRNRRLSRRRKQNYETDPEESDEDEKQMMMKMAQRPKSDIDKNIKELVSEASYSFRSVKIYAPGTFITVPGARHKFSQNTTFLTDFLHQIFNSFNSSTSNCFFKFTSKPFIKQTKNFLFKTTPLETTCDQPRLHSRQQPTQKHFSTWP